MSVAERHPGAELLSAYLDDEVARKQRSGVESHLEECSLCRRQLDGLRRVAATLRRLERAAPPPVLDLLVRRRIALDEAPKGIASRWQNSTLLLGGLSSQVGIMFALVFALAAILYLFAQGLEWRSRSEPVLVPLLDSVEVPVEDRVRRTANRLFEQKADAWWQLGVESGPARSLGAQSEQALDVLAGDPGLAELLSEAGAVVLVHDGELVRLVAAPQ